jgi:hypothetical protein
MGKGSLPLSIYCASEGQFLLQVKNLDRSKRNKEEIHWKIQIFYEIGEEPSEREKRKYGRESLLFFC